MDIFVDSIKSSSKISDIISRVVPIKPNGTNRFKCLCPFHGEKTPSFNIDDFRGIYKCFGCGEAGDVLQFVQKYHKLSFKESLEYIANLIGMEVPKYGKNSDESYDNSKQYLRINAEVAQFFFKNILQSEKGQSIAEKYLASRGISLNQIELFKVGYAPDSYNDLISYLRLKGFEEKLILDAGIARKSQNGSIYSVFRDRIMVPICDGNGNVIAFGGRCLNENNQPKYLNSQETPVFKKSHTLYNLHNAKTLLKSVNYCLVVEGYMDVISLSKLNSPVVATLGTAVSESQISLMARYTNLAIIWFDADAAGQGAGIKIAQIAMQMEKLGLEIKFVAQNKAKDPDEYIRKYGEIAARMEIENAISMCEFIWKSISFGVDFSAPDSTINLHNKISEICAGMINKVMSYEYSRYFKDQIYRARFQKKVTNSAVPTVLSSTLSKIDILEGLILYIIYINSSIIDEDFDISFKNDVFAGVLDDILLGNIPNGEAFFAKIAGIPLQNVSKDRDLKNQLQRLVLSHKIEVIEVEMKQILTENPASAIEKINIMLGEKKKLLEKIQHYPI